MMNFGLERRRAHSIVSLDSVTVAQFMGRFYGAACDESRPRFDQTLQA